MDPIKLLAPAGSFECLKAAVEHGADAVYLGGKRFGARKFANNFDDQQMKEAIRYAHLRGVQIYVTVNTLASDRDLKGMVDYASKLYSWDADAVIVQDVGAAWAIRKLLPDLPVHASTQMTIHNHGQVKWADQMGLKAVVLSREVPLHSVEEMFKGMKTLPEVFVHGALCYSFSGQCLFSYIHQERSANKGACAQPCRRAYKLVKEVKGRKTTQKSRGKYPLCMKDLCTIEGVQEIVDSPVKVLKVEGRMKGEHYVAATTAIYRKYIDQALSGEFKGVEKKDLDLLWLAYNREFTKGYIFDQRFEEVKSRLRPDNRGLLLGTIKYVDNKKEIMKIRRVTDIVPNKNDVLKVVSNYDYRVKNLNLHVKRADVEGENLILNSHRDAAKGDQVYLATHDIVSYLDPIDKSLSVELFVEIRKGSRVKMTAKGPDVNISVEGTMDISKARTSPLTKESVLKQVEKTEPFNVRLKSIDIKIGDDCFVPIGEINKVRRDIFTKVEDNWLKRKFPTAGAKRGFTPKDIFGKQKGGRKFKVRPHLSVITSSQEDLPWLRDRGTKRIYLDGLYRIGSKKERGDVLDACVRLADDDLYLKVPRITFDNYLSDLDTLFERLDGNSLGGFRVGNWGALESVHQAFPQADIHAGVGFNVTNSVAARSLTQTCSRVTVSQEMEPLEIKDMLWQMQEPHTVDVLAGGYHTVMITQDCLLGSSVDTASTGPGGFYDKKCNGTCKDGRWFLKDYKKRHYPLWMDPQCRGHLFNHRIVPTDFRDMRKMGVGSYILDLRGFNPKDRQMIVKNFSKQLGDAF